MIMTYFRLSACFVAFFFSLAIQAQAAYVGAELDSSGFDYKYEMDVLPSTQDLDGNLTNDYSSFGTNSVSGGLLKHDSIGGDGNALDGSIANSIWKAEFATGDFTMEYSAQVLTQVSGPTGERGSFQLFGSSATQRVAVVVGTGDVVFRYGAELFETILTADNTDSFHTFRAALSGGSTTSTAYVWRDDVLIHEQAYANASFSAAGWFGDFSGAIAGSADVDYVRITSGVFGPVTVPEPSTFILLATGLVGPLAFRRRSKRRDGQLVA